MLRHSQIIRIIYHNFKNSRDSKYVKIFGCWLSLVWKTVYLFPYAETDPRFLKGEKLCEKPCGMEENLNHMCWTTLSDTPLLWIFLRPLGLKKTHIIQVILISAECDEGDNFVKIPARSAEMSMPIIFLQENYFGIDLLISRKYSEFTCLQLIEHHNMGTNKRRTNNYKNVDNITFWKVLFFAIKWVIHA